MLKSIIANKKNQIFFLLINSIIFSCIYIYNQPIDFHCDSATFYNYASHISKVYYRFGIILIIFLFVVSWNSLFFSEFRNLFTHKFTLKKIILSLSFLIVLSISVIIISKYGIDTPYSYYYFLRPPIYPLFLALSGLFLFNTFYIFIFFQTLLSLCTIYFIYIIFIHLTENRYFAFFLTLLFGVTSIPYILITFMSAEQLMYFFVILTFYSIISFYKKGKYFFLYLGLFSSIFCWLTKWEGQLVFIAFILFFILNFIVSKNKKNFFIHFIIISVVTLIILLTWTTIRSVVTKDFSSILNISNSSMDQSMWRVYTSLPSSVAVWEKAFKLEKNNTGKFISEIHPNQPPGTILIHSDNGKYSSRLFKLIYESLQNDPGSYKKLINPLNDAHKSNSQKNIDYYYELFGKFNNNREIVNNIMYQPNIYYFNFFNEILVKKIGKKQKDELYKNAIKESLINNPAIFIDFLNNMLAGYGINMEQYMLHNNNAYAHISDHDFIVPYNGGKCAENNLTAKHFNEYKNSHINYNKFSSFKKIIEFNDSINDYIRNYFGIIILIAYFIILFSNFVLFMPLVFIPASLTLAVAILVDSPVNSKYEVIIFAANYILLGYFIFLVFNKLFNFFKKNYE